VTSTPTLSLVIPTYRRPEELRNCLAGVASQTRAPDEVIVVRRVNDVDAAAVLSEADVPVRETTVDVPGVVAALRAGVEASSGDVVAFIDDDAVPRSDWIERLQAHYVADRDGRLGGVGGRDVIHGEADGRSVRERHDVGVLRWWGRLVGNHHLGAGPPRPVDVLKGCNCSFRRPALSLPVGLRGTGAVVAHDLATSLRARSDGYCLLYDPALIVDHYRGWRPAGDGRVSSSKEQALDGTYNTAYAICSVIPGRRYQRAFYCLLVGDVATPGLLRTAVARVRSEHLDVPLGAAVGTVLQALRDSRTTPLRFVPAASSSENRS
jgi:GT2 family glycosyltransferase